MPPKKSRKASCPNPLFIKWLEEWKSEAEERGMNSKWTYAKAIASIKKYPLPLRSGKEAKILENIGDGIAKRLDQQLGEYLQNGGDLTDLHQVEPDDLPEFSPQKRKRKKKTSVAGMGSPDGVKTANANDIGMAFSPDAKCLRPNARAYLPKYRSGPYAIIITLYQECQKPTYLGYLSRNELQELAQPLCDKSFTTPDAGSHYTAWSFMGTLTEKGYVVKRSNPAKYYITDTGCELAHKLLNGNLAISNTPMTGIPNGANANQVSKHKRANNGRRSPVPQAGDGLLSELHDIMQQLNQTSATKNKKTSATLTKPPPLPDFGSPNETKHVKSTNSNAVGGGQRLGGKKNIDPFSPGGYYSNLQDKLRSNAKDPNANLAKNSSLNTSINHNAYVKPTVTDINKSFGVVDLDESYTPPKEFNYWYVMESGKTSLHKSQALVTIDDTIGLGFLVKTRRSDLQASGALFKIDETRPSVDGFVFAYIADKDSRNIARPTTDMSASSSTQTKPTQNSNVIKKPAHSNHTTTTSLTKPAHINHTNTQEISHISTNKKHPTGNYKITSSSISTSMSTAKSVTSTSAAALFAQNNSSNKDKENIASVDAQPLFSLPPGLFDVILCVDVTETSSSGKRNKEMADKLSKSGKSY